MTTQFDTYSNDGDATLDNTTGHWNNIMHKEERIGVTVKKFIDLCEATFKDFDKDLLLGMVWNKGYKALTKFNTKTGRKELKKKAKFTSTSLKKPPRSGYIIFNTERSAECKKNERKYEKALVEKEWQNMTEEQKDVYRNKARDLNEAYRNALQKEKEQAIKDGTYPADKPKRPVNEWILFRTEIYSEIAEKHKPTEAEISVMNDEELATYKKEIQRKIQNEIKDRWDGLSAKKKNKYIAIKNERQKQYLADMEVWNKNEEARLMKIRATEENSKQSMNLSVKNVDSNTNETESLSESSDDNEEVVESTNANNNDNTSETNTDSANVDTVQVTEEVEVTEEVVVKAPKTKKGAKNAKAKAKAKEQNIKTEKTVSSPVKNTAKKGKKPVKKRVITVASDTDTSDTESD